MGRKIFGRYSEDKGRRDEGARGWIYGQLEGFIVCDLTASDLYLRGMSSIRCCVCRFGRMQVNDESLCKLADRKC